MSTSTVSLEDIGRYGAFNIVDDIAYWNRDADVKVKLKRNCTSSSTYEGFWNPSQRELQNGYHTAISGLCIWGKYDCVLYFKPRGKGNPGAERSFSNPKDRVDLLKRLNIGQQLDRLVISKNPFGLYQSKLIDWQAQVVRRYHIKQLYYALPISEYLSILQDINSFLPIHFTNEIIQTLYIHQELLEQRIRSSIPTEVKFIHPMQYDDSLSVEQSYMWPYQHIELDLGIEEMEEVNIPYQAMKSGALIPPVLLGMLGMPCPYYERRIYHCHSDYICLMI